MTILSSILKNALSSEEVRRSGYYSPPPSALHNAVRRRRLRKSEYAHVTATVDNTPPAFDPEYYFQLKRLEGYKATMLHTHAANVKLLRNIFCIYKEGGKVDCWWRRPPPQCKSLHTDERAAVARNINKDNLAIHKRLKETGPKVDSARKLALDWKKNKARIVESAQLPFVLFDPVPKYPCQDSAFESPADVRRPRVHLDVRVRRGCRLARLLVELFEDACPRTCALFAALLRGDEAGRGYVGTQFFRVVPGMYWSGGDVIHDNGFGCYSQEGHRRPMRAEGYHFSHTMPGLLSMRVTEHDEVCGHFNIMFKAMPQFDLKNVIFGRVLNQEVLPAAAQYGAESASKPGLLIGAAHFTEQGCRRAGRPNASLRDTAYWQETRRRLKEHRAVLKYDAPIPGHV